MPYIGSSPLGLTFESNKDDQQKSSIREYRTSADLGISNKDGDGQLYMSIFGNSLFSPFPDKVDIGTDTSTGNVNSKKSPSVYHSTDIYDTSITSIISYTKQYRTMQLLASDFAYLKDIGVFPNNRLMVARRFAGPVRDDLTSYGKNGPVPLATLVSWTPDGNDFISLSFGEEWVSADSSFKDVLNDIGKDMKMSSDNSTNVGSAAAAAFNAIPLPGFMESLQYRVLNKMGLSDVNSVSGLPGGNPNLIREARMRKTLKSEEPGSGLKADVSIQMVVEYEQKFINGVDPTLVYYDIITNILSFGTSESSFQFSGAFGAGVSKTLQQFISGDVKGILAGIKSFVTSLINAISELGRELIQALINPPKFDNTSATAADTLYAAFSSVFAGTIGAVIGKYKIRIQGIANALTGAHSTPWHITIGNPKKPLFSSADMYTTDVKLTMGPILAFNDLPSSIKVEFTLKNARNLGAQEIFNKFNASGGRTYRRLNLSFADVRLNAATSSSNYNIPGANQPINSNSLDGKINVSEQSVYDREGRSITNNESNSEKSQNAQDRGSDQNVTPSDSDQQLDNFGRILPPDE